MANSLSFRSAAATNVGLVRKINEDSLLERPDVGLWAVADGMGGHGGGDVASQATVSALRQMERPASALVFRREFEKRVCGVNYDLLRLAEGRNGFILGTTLVALLIYEAHYACIWCGDSRAYLLRGGALTQVSHDHSEVQALIDSGALGMNEARTWPGRSVVTRAVGASDQLDLDMVDGPVAPGDRFLLCSDGLVAHVLDSEIAQQLSGSSPEQACGDLIRLTLERGATDNVSVVVIDCA